MKYCIVCKSHNHKKINTTKMFGTPLDNVKCTTCGLGYLYGDPKELKKIIDKHYREIYYNNYSKNSDISFFHRLYVWFIEKTGLKYATAMSQYSFLKPYLKNKKTFLDVGCGLGQALHVFEDKGFDVTGLELDKAIIKDINSKLSRGKCLYSTLEDFAGKTKNKFDIIFVSHTFEHFIDSQKVLDDFSRIMDDDGILFIEVPNCGNKAIMEGSTTIMVHTFHFSKKTISKLLNDNGFEVVKISTCTNKFFIEPKWWTYTKYYLSGKDIFFYGSNEDCLRLIVKKRVNETKKMNNLRRKNK
jgi:2-polyprenyl-3-methyl-5-hydroxy-6-metoxy-1,4-benzoquinol methylase